MVVVMLLAVLGTFSVMSARNIFPRMRVDRASSRLAFQLQLARSEAIATNRAVWVSLDPNTHRLHTWVGERNESGNIVEREISDVTIAPPGEVSVQTSWTDGLFNAYGQFITVPGQRVMQTETTTISEPGGRHSIQLTVRGSGAITKR